MNKKSLHQFYLDLIPNLLTELFFYIPEKEIPKDIFDTNDFFKTTNVFNRVFVFDQYEGPIAYAKGRSNKYIFLMATNLERNIFDLLEKQSLVKENEFNYVLEKYSELVGYLFHITNWMNLHLIRTVQADNTLIGIFHLQSLNYKKHSETLARTFYPTKKMIPKERVASIEKIKTFLPDIPSGLKRSDAGTFGSFNLERSRTKLATTINKDETTNSQKPAKFAKKPLVTNEEAEEMLLKTFFNIKTKD